MNSFFYIDLPTRFRDLDALGHVNNAVYITYFEEGRKSFFLSHINEKESAFEFPFILAHIQCDYKRPITLNDAIGLQMWVGSIGNKSFDFLYEIIDRTDKTLIYAAGKSVQVSFDYKLQKSIPIPETLKHKLLSFLKNGA
ncbi:MAG: thioesterase family protein [Pseudomonadota bacterium]